MSINLSTRCAVARAAVLARLSSWLILIGELAAMCEPEFEPRGWARGRIWPGRVRHPHGALNKNFLKLIRMNIYICNQWEANECWGLRAAGFAISLSLSVSLSLPAMEAIGSQSPLSFSSSLCKVKVYEKPCVQRIRINGRLEIVARTMLAPRKFMQRRKKQEVFKDAADEAEQRNWRRMMTEIDEQGSAVQVLRTQRARAKSLPRDLVLGTLVRFKQLKKWSIVSEILEWLRTQHWWDFNEMDFLMLITAYGKLGDFSRAERVLKYMNKKGYAPSVISHTALMEAYGRAGQYSKAETIFRRMESSGPDPSPLTYQIILKTFVEGNKFEEAESVFQNLLHEERASFKPDQQMFHMMIYMYRKAGNYHKARKMFAEMAERGIPRNTVTFNSLMSFENSYKEVSSIYDQMQRSGLRPDVVSYTLLISAYGKGRREDEALAVFEEMLDAGVRPTRKAYNTLLDAFAICGMVEEAKTAFKCMRRDKITPDLCSYATVISAYVNASDMVGAEKFFRRLKEDGLKPNAVVYGTLMKGYAMANDVERVMRVYDRMRAQGVEPNQTIYTTIMDVHGKNSSFGSAVLWFKEMSACGFPPDLKAKNVLLSLAKSTEEQKAANELVGDVVVSDLLKPTASVSAELIGENYDEKVDRELYSINENDEESHSIEGRDFGFDETDDEEDEECDFASVDEEEANARGNNFSTEKEEGLESTVRIGELGLFLQAGKPKSKDPAIRLNLSKKGRTALHSFQHYHKVLWFQNLQN
ncbi:Pentatricopeptide repeat-containing protein [Apostasia shenzhenica]|uniref:Pentatricopeptide repeat-containing protein n=1 Tax=Apostasia shenzhenica TaxID=1088818 RepID=A0A2I0B872_9ASPA|nr:Pentatricopeptide repeat-containing protein [Apostasia shenzhenica]